MPTTMNTVTKKESNPTSTDLDLNRFKIDFNLFVPNTTEEVTSSSN